MTTQANKSTPSQLIELTAIWVVLLQLVYLSGNFLGTFVGQWANANNPAPELLLFAALHAAIVLIIFPLPLQAKNWLKRAGIALLFVYCPVAIWAL